ncbi:MAG: hypothetical protein EA425_07195 [Puniceicoccaceae bacterium]|nr:MAG: hypothetical protein EA425_07195 [Puniceicoccaceae bacterium]
MARDRQTHRLLNRILGLSLLVLLLAGASGLGIVWLRQQIGVSAAETQQARASIEALAWKLRSVEAEIAACTKYEFLMAQNRAFQLGLVPPKEDQIVRVMPGLAERFADKRYQDYNIVFVSAPEEGAR